MKVEISDGALQIISSALEVYSRLQTGQFRIALEEAFPESMGEHSFDDLAKLEHDLQKTYLPELVKSKKRVRACCADDDEGCPSLKEREAPLPAPRYHRILQTSPDTFTGWSIKKTIDEYLSVKGNGGSYGFGVNFQGPIEPCLEFKFIDQKWQFVEYDIFADKDHIRDMISEVETKPLGWGKIWEYVDEIWPKEDRPFYRSDSMSILPIGVNCLGDLNFGVRVYKPYKVIDN